LGYVLPFGQMSLWGKEFCPTCYNKLGCFDLNYMAFSPTFVVFSTSKTRDCNNLAIKSSVSFNIGTLPFNSSKVRSLKRIGPHNYEILSILFGSLLGDGYAEKHGEGTRVCFQQEGSHTAYLLWFHNYLSRLGYCSHTIPTLQNRLALHGKIRQMSRFKTFTFSSFNWIEECFYIQDKVLHRRIKVVPSCIEEFLSPLALAIWIMDDGVKYQED